MDAFATFIEKFTDGLGRLNSMLVLPLLGVVFFEVIMRYVFNAPTVWGFEMTVFLYGVHFMLGLAMTLGRGGHVQVDVITSRLKPRTRAIMGIISYCVLFLPVWLTMSYASIKYAITSTIQHELNPTSWAPPIWPLKILMALGFVALTLQGIVELIRNIETCRGLDEQ